MSGPSAEEPVRPDIVGFLRARLDEDEAAARDAWQPNWSWYVEEERIDLQDGAEGRVSMEALRKADARHIARHDPARVLREVEAKRRILDRHAAVWIQARGGIEVCMWCDEQAWPCPDLRDLAAVSDQHPDYDPAWRPS